MLTACAAKRDHYDVPAVNLPKEYNKTPSAEDVADFKNSPPPSAPSLTPVLSSTFSTALTEWWRLLGSEELNNLMDRALANNPDLRIAILRIAQSKARLDQASGGRYPVISMPIQMNTTYPEFGVGRGNANGINSARPLNQLSIKGDWRPDIWGETASIYESAELQLLRSTYQRDDIQRTATANLALAYIEYLSLNDRLKIARETEKSLQEMLASVNARLKIGDATITEMEQQKSAVYSVRSTIPVIAQQREVVLNRIAAMVGSAPVAMKLSHNGLNSIRFPMVLPGVPSALLLRRPDVRAMESRLLSADADIDIARARVLPPLDLTAQVGYGSMYMSQLFMPQALFWNTLASLSVTIFDGGKRAKEVEFAQAVHEELLETYVRVIYDAVREVDDALSAISFNGRRLDDQAVATDSALRAWNYSQEVFMSGAIDYLALLDTQRTYQRNLDDWHTVRLERYRGLVNLFSALGGGVPSGDVMPGEGLRPALLADEIDYGSVFTEADSTASAKSSSGKKNKAGVRNNSYFVKSSASAILAAKQANKALLEKIDWAGDTIKKGDHLWLAEISGVYDRGAVLPAWRDWHARFPRQLNSLHLLPQRQGEVTVAKKERASWYRLYISNFADSKSAENFCSALRATQQSCVAVAADLIKGKGDFITPPGQGDTPTASGEEKEIPPSDNDDPEVSSDESGKEKIDGIDWSGESFWLVETPETYERNNLASAWRNLRSRFPDQLKNKTILPRRQINANNAGQNIFYQLFIAKFPQKEIAENFCAILQSSQQKCTVVESQSLADNKKTNAAAAGEPPLKNKVSDPTVTPPQLNSPSGASNTVPVAGSIQASASSGLYQQRLAASNKLFSKKMPVASIQLFYQKELIEDRIEGFLQRANELNKLSKIYLLPAKFGNTAGLRVLYGAYPSADAAHAAIRKLPQRYKKGFSVSVYTFEHS